MPSTYDLPDYPVTVHAEKEKPIRISPGGGKVWVDDEPIAEPVVVTEAVKVTGWGTVTTAEVAVPKKTPRKPRPSELRAKAEKAKKGKK